MNFVHLALLYLFSRRGASTPYPYGAPVAPGGTAVTSMKTGSRYAVTLLFRGLGPGQATPTPDILAASAKLVPTPASAFTVESANVLPNADGTYSAQLTGTYHGGNVLLENQAWQLLQLQAA